MPPPNSENFPPGVGSDCTHAFSQHEFITDYILPELQRETKREFFSRLS